MSDAIKLEHVYKVFPSPLKTGQFTAALNDINLRIEQGSFTIIGGANGSGKSVLMSVIAGLMEPSDGTVTVASKPGLVFQDAAIQILGDTPREDVAIGPRNLRRNKNEIPEIVTNALSRVSLLQKADYPAEFLSGGEKRRLAVASILAMDKDIILFDEPYANLDYPGIKDVNNLLLKLTNEGKTIILLTHELEKCLSLANHFIILQSGKIVFDGSPKEALEKPLEQWSIRNPLVAYNSIEDMIW